MRREFVTAENVAEILAAHFGVDQDDLTLVWDVAADGELLGVFIGGGVLDRSKIPPKTGGTSSGTQEIG